MDKIPLSRGKAELMSKILFWMFAIVGFIGLSLFAFYGWGLINALKGMTP